MKIIFKTDDNLPLNKPLKLRMLTIIVRSVFEDSKFYLQVDLDGCLLNYKNVTVTKKVMFQKEMTLSKQAHQKNACFVIISTLKLDSHLSKMMKNVFYFILKALFLLKIFKFLS